MENCADAVAVCGEFQVCAYCMYTIYSLGGGVDRVGSVGSDQ